MEAYRNDIEDHLLPEFEDKSLGEIVGPAITQWEKQDAYDEELTNTNPKDDSYRSVDLPRFLHRMVNDHIRRTKPQPCPCHSRTYVFRGLDASNGAARKVGATLIDVGRVSTSLALTPHSLRHTHKTRMRGLRTPPKLMDDRLGHLDGTVQAKYDHITREMREELLAGLTVEWETALDTRRAMWPTSPVVVLSDLLQMRAHASWGARCAG